MAGEYRQALRIRCAGTDQRVVRFCFAKKDETLKLSLERLAKL